MASGHLDWYCVLLSFSILNQVPIHFSCRKCCNSVFSVKTGCCLGCLVDNENPLNKDMDWIFNICLSIPCKSSGLILALDLGFNLLSWVKLEIEDRSNDAVFLGYGNVPLLYNCVCFCVSTLCAAWWEQISSVLSTSNNPTHPPTHCGAVACLITVLSPNVWAVPVRKLAGAAWQPGGLWGDKDCMVDCGFMIPLGNSAAIQFSVLQ